MSIPRNLITITVALISALAPFAPVVAAEPSSVCPEYYNSLLDEKCPIVEKLKGSQRDCFFFWTDAHLSANSGNTPSVIQAVAGRAGMICRSEQSSPGSDRSFRPKVIFGGDAVPAYGTDYRKFIGLQYELNSRIRAFARNYNARGNHDYTITAGKKDYAGATCPRDSASMLLLQTTEADVVTNPDDPGSCYYYFDEPEAKIRYFVFDTVDTTVVKPGRGGGNKPRVGKVQLSWMFDKAVPSTPKGWSLVFVSHIPFISAFASPASVSLVSGHIEAIGEKRPDLKVLLCISGHNHHDFAMYRNGILYVMNASDAMYADFRRSPFHKNEDKRAKGSAREIAFDYVSISEKSIDMVRFGVCASRSFQLKPMVVKRGKTGDMSRLCPDAKNWFCYDSEGSAFIRKSSAPREWILMNEVATVSPEGLLTAKSKGEAVLMALDSKGTEHYFDVVVK